MGGYRTKVTAATPQLLPTGQIGAFVAAALERGDSVQYVPAQIALPFTDIVTVTTLALPVGLEGFAYTAALAALGGTLPYTWGATGLPSWATLSGNTISGTPNSTAPSTLTVTATDADGRVSLPVVLSLQVSGVGLGVFAYAGGSEQRAYVVPGPGIVAAALPPPTNPGPQAMWPGYADTSSYLFSWWPPPITQQTWIACGFTARIDNGTPGNVGNILTVSAMSVGSNGFTPVQNNIAAGQTLSGNAGNVPGGLTILAQTSGTTGGVGTYTVSGSASVASEAMYTSAVPTPTFYKVYKLIGGVPTPITTGMTSPPLTNAGITANPTITNAQAGFLRPVPWFIDTGIPAGQSNTYQVSAMVGGVESALSQPLTMTALTTNSTVLPTPPADPATWAQDGSGALNLNTFVLPTGGTTWTATVTSAATTGSNGWNTPGTVGVTGKLSVGCGFQYALNNALANDIVVLTAGAQYASPGAGWSPPAYSGAGWIYVISSQEPVYQASIGGTGTLPAYSYTQAKPWQPVTCTGTSIAAGATTATLGTGSTPVNWTQKTGWYYVLFYEPTNPSPLGITEERLALFTQGSSAITWASLNGLYPSAGLAYPATILSGQSNIVINVMYLSGVTPADLPSMPQLAWGTQLNAALFTLQAATAKLRFVGINMQPTAGVRHSELNVVSFQNVTSFVNPAPCDHIYFDRCALGNDTNAGWSNWAAISHGLGAVNCNHLFVGQCYFWGIVNDQNASGGDSNNYCLGGGYHCWQNNYLQLGSESLIYGSEYVSPRPDTPHDIVVRYNASHRPRSWLLGEATVASSISLTGATLQTAWPFATGSFLVRVMNTGGTEQSVIANLQNGSRTVTWTLTIGGTLVPTFAVIGPGSCPFGNWGWNVKDHFECKCAIRYEAHDNLVLNAWMALIQSYHSGAFVATPRDQIIAAAGATAPNQACPWSVITDWNVHDNLCYFIGSPFYTFTGDNSPSVFAARLRFVNNQSFINPLNGSNVYIERVTGMQLAGPVADVFIDHNTQICNTGNTIAIPFGNQPQRGMSFIVGGLLAGSYPSPSPFAPNANGMHLYQDRLTLTNNVVDSGIPAGQVPPINLAFYFLNGAPTLDQYPAATLTCNKNLTISDTTTTYGSTPGITYVPGTINQIPYASVGMANFQGNNAPPRNPSDWNIVSGAQATASTTGGPVGATVVPPQGLQFPLVGGVYIAGSVQTSFGTSAFQDAIANNNDVAVIGIYPGWSSGGFNAQSAAAAIKAINPTIKLVPYTNIMELEAGVGPSGSAYSPIFNAATTMNWFLRTAWPAGSITDADGNAQDGLNQTTFTVAGTGSYAGYANYLAWRASWTAANEYPGSNWDGVYLDNVFSIPRVSADYNQSGSSQTASAAKTNWQNGYVAYAAPGGYLRTALPAGKLVFGNSADWANTSVTAYNGMLDGPVIEGVTTYQTTWATQIAAYKASMLNTRTPSFAIYCQDGVVTNYQFFRYGFTMCLLDNAYYYHSNNGSYDTVEVYDEYSFNLGAPIAGPNNAGNGTLSSGGLTVWKSQGPSGVWRRDFVNGIAICNPAGNGSQSVVVDVSVNYWHLRGTQANPPNSATEVTAGSSVTLADGDGLILSRTAT